LLERNGFAVDSIKITPRQADLKSVPKLPNKAPLLEPLTFTVSGRATLENIVQMLHDFHATNLLHNVRNLSLALVEDRTVSTTPAARAGARGPARGGRGRGPGARTRQRPSGQINLTMTVEAMVVSGGEERGNLMPPASVKKPRILAEPSRRYEDMARRNM